MENDPLQPMKKRWYIRSKIIRFVARVVRVKIDLHPSYYRVNGDKGVKASSCA